MVIYPRWIGEEVNWTKNSHPFTYTTIKIFLWFTVQILLTIGRACFKIRLSRPLIPAPSVRLFDSSSIPLRLIKRERAHGLWPVNGPSTFIRYNRTIYCMDRLRLKPTGGLLLVSRAHLPLFVFITNAAAPCL